jgi:hypothetical protein
MRLGGLCTAGCLVLVAKGALAGDGDAQERSAALFREGVAAGKTGDYGHAEVAFRTSYLLVPSPSTLRNWALTEMKMGKMLEALGHLKLAIKSTGLTAEQRAIVQQNLEDAYAATGHLVIKTTDGARVAIDGVFVEAAAPFDAPLDVTAGDRQIEARLGTQTAHAEVDAKAGRIVEVSVPVPLTAQENPGAPPALMATAPATEPERSRASPPTWWTSPHAVAVGLAGAAAVGVGLGIYFDVASRQTASDANALRAGLRGMCAEGAVAPECAGLRDKIDTVHQQETLKVVGLAAGAAAGVGAALLLVVVGPGVTARTGSVRWAPMIAPESSGVAGSF